jgi:hypothetical protein
VITLLDAISHPSPATMEITVPLIHALELSGVFILLWTVTMEIFATTQHATELLEAVFTFLFLFLKERFALESIAIPREG